MAAVISSKEVSFKSVFPALSLAEEVPYCTCREQDKLECVVIGRRADADGLGLARSWLTYEVNSCFESMARNAVKYRSGS